MFQIFQSCLREICDNGSQVSISSTFFARIFHTIDLTAFFSYMYVEKADEKTLVRKIRTYNVDEIDTSMEINIDVNKNVRKINTIHFAHPTHPHTHTLHNTHTHIYRHANEMILFSIIFIFTCKTR